MKVDVEITLPANPAAEDYGLKDFLPDDYFIEERGMKTKCSFLRASSSVGERIDETVAGFLAGLQPLAEKIKSLRAELRIGVFYDLEETVVFPFPLKTETVRAIAEYGLALDAILYACGPEDDK